MMRIDAHQHFWQYNPAEHGWMTDEMAALRRDFMPQDLKPLLDRTGFDGCVAVQVRQSLEETRWLLDVADKNDFIKGVVGWVDLCSAELPAQLEKFTKHRKLVGVRHIVQDEANDEFMLREDFRRGIARLADYGLKYDVLIYPRQLPAAAKLVAEFPEQPFVLDHIAKPQIAEGKIAPWEAGLRALAKLPNICCKVSGMVTEARWKQWRADDFRPYLDVVFDAFGAERLMIGSDWPVCTLSADYEETIELLTDYLKPFPNGALDKIIGASCARFYGLK